MRNPNIIRRTRFASAAALLAAGAIACTGKSVSPSETVDNKPIEAPPACTSITATPDTAAPHTMKIALETTGSMDVPPMWRPDHAEYTFGDGTGASDALGTTHTYPNAGAFTVNASIVMDVAVPNAPFKNDILSCPPTPITVP